MNIFFLNKHPKIAAELQSNIHINKMLVEATQLLANCYSLEHLKEAPLTSSLNYRTHSYLHHPTAQWVLSSFSHWKWLVEHAYFLEEERLYREYHPSISSIFVEWSLLNPPTIRDCGFISPPLAFGKFTGRGTDYVDSYKLYYRECKRFDKNGNMMAYYRIRKPSEDLWREYYKDIMKYYVK